MRIFAVVYQEFCVNSEDENVRAALAKVFVYLQTLL